MELEKKASATPLNKYIIASEDDAATATDLIKLPYVDTLYPAQIPNQTVFNFMRLRELAYLTKLCVIKPYTLKFIPVSLFSCPASDCDQMTRELRDILGFPVDYKIKLENYSFVDLEKDKMIHRYVQSRILLAKLREAVDCVYDQGGYVYFRDVIMNRDFKFVPILDNSPNRSSPFRRLELPETLNSNTSNSAASNVVSFNSINSTTAFNTNKRPVFPLAAILALFPNNEGLVVELGTFINNNLTSKNFTSKTSLFGDVPSSNYVALKMFVDILIKEIESIANTALVPTIYKDLVIELKKFEKSMLMYLLGASN